MFHVLHFDFDGGSWQRVYSGHEGACRLWLQRITEALKKEQRFGLSDCANVIYPDNAQLEDSDNYEESGFCVTNKEVWEHDAVAQIHDYKVLPWFVIDEEPADDDFMELPPGFDKETGEASLVAFWASGSQALWAWANRDGEVYVCS